jgi:hypothetical protein
MESPRFGRELLGSMDTILDRGLGSAGFGVDISGLDDLEPRDNNDEFYADQPRRGSLARATPTGPARHRAMLR